MKTKYKSYDATGFIDPLYRAATVLAVAPTCIFEEKNSTWKTNKIRGMVMILFILTGYVLSVAGRVYYCYPWLPTASSVITDALFNFVLTVANALSILIPLTYAKTNFLAFLNAFETADSLLKGVENVIRKNCRGLHVKLILGHTFVVVLFIYDAYVWIKYLGLERYTNYAFQNIQNYYTFIVIMMIDNFLLSLRWRFRTLNELLDKVSLVDSVSNFNISAELKDSITQLHPYQKVQMLSEDYNILITQITYFNQIFGWQILFTIATIAVGLLNTFNVLIVYGVSENGSVVPGYDFIILNIFWSMLQFTYGTVLIVSCNSTAQEAQKTAEICDRLLLRIPTLFENSQDRALREQLHLLTQLSSQRCPDFSAAGFFNIDYPLLLSLLGSITSYVIVIIEFNK